MQANARTHTHLMTLLLVLSFTLTPPPFRLITVLCCCDLRSVFPGLLCLHELLLPFYLLSPICNYNVCFFYLAPYRLIVHLSCPGASVRPSVRPSRSVSSEYVLFSYTRVCYNVQVLDQSESVFIIILNLPHLPPSTVEF